MKEKRFYELDALKGIAACIVAFFWHYQHFGPSQGSPFEHVFSLFYKYGQVAVEFFFLVSGFVMLHVYEEKIAEGKLSLREYMGRRVMHLYPLSLLTLLVVAVIQSISFAYQGKFFVYPVNDVMHFMYNLLLCNYGIFDLNFSFNGPSWCIPVEMICYFLLFWVVYYTGKAKEKRYIYMVVLILFGIFCYMQSLRYPIVNYQVARGLISFFMGCLLCKGYREIVKRKIETRVGCTSLFLLMIIAGVMQAFQLNVGNFWNQVQFMMFLVAPLILYTAICLKPLKVLLGIRPLVYLGKISFSIYMWHFPVQIFLMTLNLKFGMKMDFSSYKMFFVYILSTLAIAVFSYEFLEKVTRKAIRRIVSPSRV